MVETRDGYVVDLTYSSQAFVELSPLSIAVMAEMSGQKAPAPDGLRYLELGFGQGVTLNVSAAANPGAYEGVDFIGGHVAHARGLAEASGADLALHERSFAEFAEEDGEPFDMIALHGVWSWVDDAARAAIAAIVDKRLRPGGLALVSYNTPAGWASMEPLRLLFRRYAAASEGASDERMRAAVEFADRLRGAGAAFFAQHPIAARQLEQMKAQSPRYLVHEYLNDGYRSSSFAETGQALAEAGLAYVGPARPGEFLDRKRIAADAARIADETDDPWLAELAREFALAQRFRSDLYVKGERTAPEDGALAARRFVLTGFAGAKAGPEIGGNEGYQRLVNRVLEVLAEDGSRPKTYGEIDRACPNASFEQIGWALMSLTGAGAAAPAHDEDTVGAVSTRTQALNAEICRRAAESGDIQVLACPMTGAAVQVRGVAQMYLAAAAEGVEDPIPQIWESLKARGEAMTQQGRRLEGDGANMDALRRDHAWFTENGLARLRRLGIAPAEG